MGHEVGDTLEHAPGLQDECGEGNLLEIHANPGIRMDSFKDIIFLETVRIYLSCEMSELIIEPSCSSLQFDMDECLAIALEGVQTGWMYHPVLYPLVRVHLRIRMSREASGAR